MDKNKIYIRLTENPFGKPQYILILDEKNGYVQYVYVTMNEIDRKQFKTTTKYKNSGSVRYLELSGYKFFMESVFDATVLDKAHGRTPEEKMDGEIRDEFKVAKD
jgi:hypothetical protein